MTMKTIISGIIFFGLNGFGLWYILSGKLLEQDEKMNNF